MTSLAEINEFVDEFNKRDGDSTRDKNFIIYVHID